LPGKGGKTITTGPHEIAQGPHQGYYHYSLGVCSYLERNLEDTIREYKKALDCDPESPYLKTEIAKVYLQKENIKEALSILKGSLVHHPDYVDTHLLLGGIYTKLKKYDNAIVEYKEVIQLDPDNLESHLFLGLIYREKKEYDQAINTLNNLLTIDSYNLMGNYYLAKIYIQIKSYDKAEDLLKKVLTIKPSFEPALTDLAFVYEIQNNDQKALEFFKKFIRNNPFVQTARVQFGKILFRQEKYQEAAKEFGTILNEDRSNVEARYSLGLSYYFDGNDYKQAIEEFLTILKKHPADIRTRYFLALSYDKNGQYRKAFEEFKVVPVDSKLYASSRIHMALILKEDGRTLQAIELIKDALTKKEDADLYGILASLLDTTNELDAAERTLQNGLKIFPGDIDLHYKLGVIYEKTFRFEASVKEMQEILEIDKDNAEALNFIGYGYADRGINLNEAERLIKRAYALKPDSGFITDSLGWLYFKTGRMNLAITYLEKASNMLPEDPTIAEHLGDAYRMSGMVKEARRMYIKALELSPLKKEDLEQKINQLNRN
jgi:tetratricopeptide (TPR) repeat protein